MASSTIHAVLDNLNPKTMFSSKSSNQALPISQSNQNSENHGLRRRLSSFSVRIQPTYPSSSSWSFRRSKSMSSISEFAGTSLKKWWDWSFGWLLSKKPMFAKDLEMNEEEARMLGNSSRGTWSHVIFKVRSQLRNMVTSKRASNQGFKYDFVSYTQNFDNGSMNQG